jgi:hypothetical protein
MSRLVAVAAALVVAWLAPITARACTDAPTAPHAFEVARGGGIVAPGFVGLAGAAVIHGIDVSVVENDTNFSRARECGAQFAYVRLSEGTRDTEPLYRTHWGPRAPLASCQDRFID